MSLDNKANFLSKHVRAMGYKQSRKKGITSDLDEKEGRQSCRKSLVEIREDKK